MLKNIKEVLKVAASNLKSKIHINPKFIATEHFQKRVLQRFQNEDLPKLERAIEKAFEKAKCGSKIRYTHPFYGCTVVGQKMGINGFELVTCWLKDEDAE
jgi:aspartokinase